MERKDLLKFCRYYKGEKGNPFEGNEPQSSMLWNYEKFWFDTELAATSEDTAETQLLTEFIDEYIRAGLRTFEQTDDTPVTLKAILYNRYQHWNEGGDFKKWYCEQYKKR